MKSQTALCFAIWASLILVPLSAQTMPSDINGTQLSTTAAIDHGPFIQQGSPEVFISFDESATQDSVFHGISTFAFDLLRLRLISGTSSAIVHRGSQDKACGGRQEANTQSAAGGKKGQTSVRYYFSGTIEMLGTGASPRMAIHYKLYKCTGTESFLLIPSQDLTFTSDHSLDELSWIANYVMQQIDNEIQRERVYVRECIVDDSITDPTLPGIVHGIKARLEDALNASTEFQASSDGQGAMVLYCTLIPKFHRFVTKAFADDTLEAKISIKTNGQEKPYEDPISTIMKWADRKSEGTINGYSDDIAAKAIGALRFLRGAERVGIENSLETWEASNYLEQGKKLLNIDHASDQDFKSALEALLRANKLDGNNPVILRYLGQAQVGNRLYAEAKESLEDALNKLKSQQKKSSLEAEIDVLLGNSLLGLNAPADAADRYLKGLEIYHSITDSGDAQTTIYQKYGRALVQSNQRGKAVGALLQGVTGFPKSVELHRQTLTLIRQLSPEELNAAYNENIESYCKQPESIRDECALLAVEKAEGATEITHNEEDIRTYAGIALQFNPPGKQIRAEALGYAAMADLNMAPDKAGTLLDEAESLLTPSFQPSVRTWLRRLRSEYWLQKKDFEKADQAAKVALTEDPENRFSQFVKAEVDVRWAESLENNPDQHTHRIALLTNARSRAIPLVAERFTDADQLLALANHELELDADSRDRFMDILNRNSRDDSALETLLMVCIDWLSDFDCSLKAAHKSVESGFRAKRLEIQLDLVEAAMLKEEDADAEQWLKIVGERTELPVDLKAVRDFYAVWLALKKNNADGAKTSFASWQYGLQLLRGRGQQNQSIDWSFVGAKTFLGKGQGAEADLYLKMIRSMEDPTADLPSFLPKT